MNKIILKEILGNDERVKVAIFIFIGADDPTPALDRAVQRYVRTTGYNEFIDANMDNPWVRVIIKGINDIEEVEYDPINNFL